MNYINLTDSNKDMNINNIINKEFQEFKNRILKTNLVYSNDFDLTAPYYQQIGRNLNIINSFLYNYEMIIPFLSNNNIKNKNEFYISFIDGHIICFNHSLEGQEIILYIIYRKYSEFNCYECEIIINYSTDTLDYIYQNKIGNEKFNEYFIKYYERKNGLIFNCIDVVDEKIFKNILPYFNYIKYNCKDLNDKTIENFLETQNKEIKKTQ